MDTTGREFQLLNVPILPVPSVLFRTVEVDAAVIHGDDAGAAFAEMIVPHFEFDFLRGQAAGHEHDDCEHPWGRPSSFVVCPGGTATRAYDAKRSSAPR